MKQKVSHSARKRLFVNFSIHQALVHGTQSKDSKKMMILSSLALLIFMKKNLVIFHLMNFNRLDFPLDLVLNETSFLAQRKFQKYGQGNHCPYFNWFLQADPLRSWFGLKVHPKGPQAPDRHVRNMKHRVFDSGWFLPRRLVCLKPPIVPLLFRSFPLH